MSAGDQRPLKDKALERLLDRSPYEPYTGSAYDTPRAEPIDSSVKGYSGTQAAKVVGITYRQLDYWARTDLLTPSLAPAPGSGSRRRYSYQDLLELKIIKTLLDAGIKLTQVRKVFAYLREHTNDDITAANLVISGGDVLICDGDEVVDVLRRGHGVLNVLPLAGVIQDIDNELIPLSAQASDAAEAG